MFAYSRHPRGESADFHKQASSWRELSSAEVRRGEFGLGGSGLRGDGSGRVVLANMLGRRCNDDPVWESAPQGILLSRKTATKKMVVYSIYSFEADRFMTLDSVILLEEMEKSICRARMSTGSHWLGACLLTRRKQPLGGVTGVGDQAGGPLTRSDVGVTPMWICS